MPLCWATSYLTAAHACRRATAAAAAASGAGSVCVVCVCVRRGTQPRAKATTLRRTQVVPPGPQGKRGAVVAGSALRAPTNRCAAPRCLLPGPRPLPPCSYMCYTSAFAPEPVENNICWLSAKPAGQLGTQCPGFPNAWLGEGGSTAPGERAWCFAARWQAQRLTVCLTQHAQRRRPVLKALSKTERLSCLSPLQPRPESQPLRAPPPAPPAPRRRTAPDVNSGPTAHPGCTLPHWLCAGQRRAPDCSPAGGLEGCQT